METTPCWWCNGCVAFQTKPSTSLHLLCYLFRHTSSILLPVASTQARLPLSPLKCWHSNCFSLWLSRKHVITCSLEAYFSFHRYGIHNNMKSERWDGYETKRCFKQQFMQSFDNYSQKNSAKCLLRNDFFFFCVSVSMGSYFTGKGNFWDCPVLVSREFEYSDPSLRVQGNVIDWICHKNGSFPIKNNRNWTIHDSVWLQARRSE